MNPQTTEEPAVAERPPRHLAGKVARAAIYTSSVLGGSMLGTQTLNPIEAVAEASQRLETTSDYIRDAMGDDLCSEGPNAAERSEIRARLLARSHFLTLAQTEAVLHGLSFANPEQTLIKMEISPSPEDVTNFVSQYASENFGFEVKLDMPGSSFDQPNAEEHYQQDMKLFVQYLSLLPRELLQNINLDKVTIKSSIDKNGDGHNGRYNPALDVVEMDINRIKRPGTFIHEVLGHGVQDTSCDGIVPSTDDAFTQYNPQHFEYSGSAQSGSEFRNEGIVIREYGATHNSEDFATLIQGYMVGQVAYEHIDRFSNTPITNKLVVVLDRIEDIAPGSVNYLASVRSSFTDMQLFADTIPDFRYLG